MRAVFLFFFLCFAGYTLKAQNYKYIYYLNQDMLSVPKKNAVMIGKGYMENGNLHLDCYYTSNSLLFLKINYSDSTLQTCNGPYTSYNKDGGLLETGTYKNGFLEGVKEKWNEDGALTDSIIYHDDKAFKEYHYGYYKKRRDYFEVKDSLENTYYTKTLDEKNNVSSEAKFKGERGVVIKYKDGVATMDSVFTREETEASFPGGQPGWENYLKQYLNPNAPVEQGAKAGTYTVIVKFMVNENGEISGISPETHYGYGMETEVIRLLKGSPKWIPAIQYGRKVNAYRRQPVTFAVTEN